MKEYVHNYLSCVLKGDLKFLFVCLDLSTNAKQPYVWELQHGFQRQYTWLLKYVSDLSALSRWPLWFLVSVLLFTRFCAAANSGIENSFPSQWSNIVIIIIDLKSRQYHNWSLKLWRKETGNISGFRGMYVTNSIQSMKNSARAGNLVLFYNIPKFDFRTNKNLLIKTSVKSKRIIVF